MLTHMGERLPNSFSVHPAPARRHLGYIQSRKLNNAGEHSRALACGKPCWEVLRRVLGGLLTTTSHPVLRRSDHSWELELAGGLQAAGLLWWCRDLSSLGPSSLGALEYFLACLICFTGKATRCSLSKEYECGLCEVVCFLLHKSKLPHLI